MTQLRKLRFRRWTVGVLIFLTLVFTFGCFQEYYAPRQKSRQDLQALVAAEGMGKYFILHYGQQAWHFDQLTLSDEAISGRLSVLPPERNEFWTTKANLANRYRGPKEKYVLDEVHLWLQSAAADPAAAFGEQQLYVATSGDFERVEFYEKDQAATIFSHVIGVVGIGGSILAIILISTQPLDLSPQGSNADGSCPFVYTFDGREYLLSGELFAGAIFPQLERNDFLPLPGQQPLRGEQRLRLRNELREHQHINLARLLAVNHPVGTRVLLDRTGRPHTLRAPQAPTYAYTSAGRDVRPLLTERDRLPYVFDEPVETGNAVTLFFDRPAGAELAKLVLRAKNTRWLELMWYDFTSRYGSLYDNWEAQQAEEPAEKLLAWMAEQNLFLRVEVYDDGGWRLIDELPFAGPLTERELLVPVDLRSLPGEEVRIRLSGGYLFWQLDYAGLDLSADLPVRVESARPFLAHGSDGLDYAAALADVDTQYLHQTELEHQVDLVFPATATAPAEVQSLFLQSRGHYRPLREFRGLPEILTLRRFDEPGHFARFSQERFREVLELQGIRWGEAIE